MKKDLYFGYNDKLNRGTYAKNLKQIILSCDSYPRSNDNLSYVIGINAPWGTGKTTFNQMMINYLKGKWDSTCTLDSELKATETIYYDAWKNDFWNNAFEPLFDCIIQSPSIAKTTEEYDIKSIFKNLAEIVALGVKGVLSQKLDEFIGSDTISEIIRKSKNILDNGFNTNYQTNSFFPDYCLFHEAIELLRSILSKSIEEAGKIVVFIDELDRCKPTFAVQTLEIVKHLFNIEGLVFVFSLDINQLSHSVKSVYGNDFNSVGYLERFFNYITVLPQNNFSNGIESFLKEYKLDSINSEIKKRFQEILMSFCLSLREMRQVISSYFVLRSTVLNPYDEIDNAQILYFYFLTLKYKHQVEFSNTVFNNDKLALIEIIKNNPIPFIDCSDSDYESFYKAIACNNLITDTTFQVVSEDPFPVVANKIRRVRNLNVEFMNVFSVKISLGRCLSYILYEPDIEEYEKIKYFTVLEYIFRQLELCDFIVEEPNNENQQKTSVQ